MLRVAVVERDGSTAVAIGNVVVISDERTQVPIALVRYIGNTIEYLTQQDGERFVKALNESTFESQRGYAAANKVVVRQ